MQYKEASTVQEEPEGTVREESQITSGGGVSPDSSTKVVRSLTPARRTIEVIYMVFGIIDVVLLVRMVLKLLAADVQHKSDIGGVVLGIKDENELRAAQLNVRATAPTNRSA